MGSSEFEENGPPSNDNSAPFRKGAAEPWKHTADTRRFLGWAIVGMTLALYALLVCSVIVNWISVDQFVKLLAALSPLQALAAATVGFFFGRQSGDR